MHSDAAAAAIRHVGEQLESLNEALDGPPGAIGEDPTPEELEALSNLLAVMPKAQAIIAENRSACEKGSGYRGGCNQELADVFAGGFGDALAQATGKASADLYLGLGMAEPFLSVGGPYTKNKGPSKIEEPISRGLGVGVHNRVDWSTGKLEPLDEARKRFAAHTQVVRAKLRERAAQDEKQADRTAAPWGGTGPSSVDPLDNWGQSHPLHQRKGPEDDEGGGMQA